MIKNILFISLVVLFAYIFYFMKTTNCELTKEELINLGFNIENNKIEYKDLLPDSSYIRVAFSTTINSQTSYYEQPDSKFMNSIDSIDFKRNDFYPVLITNQFGFRNSRLVKTREKLFPVLIDLSKFKIRDSKVIVWFKVSSSFWNLFPKEKNYKRFLKKPIF